MHVGLKKELVPLSKFFSSALVTFCNPLFLYLHKICFWNVFFFLKPCNLTGGLKRQRTRVGACGFYWFTYTIETVLQHDRLDLGSSQLVRLGCGGALRCAAGTDDSVKSFIVLTRHYWKPGTPNKLSHCVRYNICIWIFQWPGPSNVLLTLLNPPTSFSLSVCVSPSPSWLVCM